MDNRSSKDDKIHNQNSGRDKDPNKSPFSEHQEAAPSRGGISDMGTDALTSGRPNRVERGSGISTKDSVTGSDYDGQLSGA